LTTIPENKTTHTNVNPEKGANIDGLGEDARFIVYEDEREVIAAYVSTCGHAV